MNPVNLPPLPKTSSAYLGVLLVMVVGFYVLLLVSLVAVGFALYELVMWTPTYFSHVRGGGAIKLLFLIYAAVCVFGWALIKGFLAKVGGDPFGIKANRRDHPKVFDLTNEVAQRVQADPIHEIFLTPEDDLGVWEEAALYLPPGMGKRKIVLGMGALNYLTIDQLRSILAHEYGHFSNRDTFFSRFIYRVSNSYDALMRQLGGDRIHLFNPLYWVLRAYVWIYERIAASFSRNREYHADRFAVEGYGQELYAQALVAAHVEGSFFSHVGLRQVVNLAAEGKAFKNLYHFVGVSRKMYEKDNPESLPKVLSDMLAQKSGAFDSHPSLSERLQAQGISPAAVQASPTPRVVADAELDKGMEADALTLVRNGAPSAAEDLFGENLPNIQAELSEMVSGKYIYLIEMMRRAQEQQG